MIVPISTSGVPFVVNDGGQGANWKQGEVIEARVTGVFSSGVARLSTQGANFDLTLPVKVALGDTVKLRLEGQGESLRFVFVSSKPVSGSLQPNATNSTASGQNTTTASATGSQTGAVGTTSMAGGAGTAEGMSAGYSAPSGAASPLGAFGAIVHQILPVLAGRQDSITALFANLHAISREQAAQLPSNIRQPLRNLAALSMTLDQPVTPTALKQHAMASGTFWEAGLSVGSQSPQNSPVSANGLQSSDVKAQLLFLKTALAGFLGKDVHPRSQAALAPPPPRAGSKPVGQAPAASTITPDMSAKQLAFLLQADVEAALSRLRLLQISSLGSSEQGHFQPHGADQSEWRFEIPIVFHGGTGVAEFLISQDSESGPDADREARHWRLQFSLDLPETGRIDALVGLHGERISVGLWTERQNMADLLSSQSEGLRVALQEAGLDIDEISVTEGTPTVASSPSGYFVDWTA
ncbi:MAG: flagellar hook-length control protein FliK [Stappiaceae bacterium]